MKSTFCGIGSHWDSQSGLDRLRAQLSVICDPATTMPEVQKAIVDRIEEKMDNWWERRMRPAK
jgi:hypothetical protein